MKTKILMGLVALAAVGSLSACSVTANVAGSASPAATATPTPTPASGVFTSDSFNRADNTSLGSTDAAAGGTSKVWIQTGDTLPSILSNSFVRNDPASDKFSTGLIDGAAATCSVQVKIKNQPVGTSGMVGLMLRYVDSDNWIAVFSDADNALGGASAGYVLLKWQAGNMADVQSIAIAPANNDVLRAELTSGQIVVKINGATGLTYTSTTFNTSTKNGLVIFGGPSNAAAVLDDFLMEDCN